jgi:hypothetical protein
MRGNRLPGLLFAGFAHVHARTFLARNKILHCWDDSLFPCLQLKYSFHVFNWNIHSMSSIEIFISNIYGWIKFHCV